MTIATTRRLAVAAAASSCALALAGCGGSTKAATTSPAAPSSASHTTTSAAATTTSTAPSIAPGPAFTESGLSKGLLAGSDVGKDYKIVTGASSKPQTQYEFGCIGGDESPPTYKLDSKDTSHRVSLLAQSGPLTSKDFHARTVLEQYVLFPSAQAAADEQKRVEATVTSDCLASHHFPSVDNMSPFTTAGTQTPYSQGGFTGVMINEDSTTEDNPPVHMQDQLIEARDGSVLVFIWMDSSNPAPEPGFRADATATMGKALDKLSATGH